MSPASKSKSKLAARAVKESPRISSKTSSPPANSGNGTLASAYHPVSGTFQTLEPTLSASLTTAQNNGRFRNIDEADEHSGSSLGTTAEYDSGSNNDSCSGESEDQKEKTTTSNAPLRECIPGSDTDKRDKIRQKNGRKHQRQKERRAQELKERCSGYLMSRKLEVLAQQLVAMGFSSEQATMALVLNEGRLEESVAWLFEGCEENKQQMATNPEGGVHLKIDITDELAKIADLEVKLKCTKQEVERAVVACEGDLDKAEETLMAEKQEAAASPKLEEYIDCKACSASDNLCQNAMVRTQVKGVASVIHHQQPMVDRDLNCINTVVTGTVLQEAANKTSESLRRIEPKQEWARPHVAAHLEKRWPISSSSLSVSNSTAAPLHHVTVQPAKVSRYAMVGNEVKTDFQAGYVREPVIVMQRPQSISDKQSFPSTSTSISAPSPISIDWYSNRVNSIDLMKVANGGLGHMLPTLGLNGSSHLQFYPPNHLQPDVSSLHPQNHLQPHVSSPPDVSSLYPQNHLQPHVSSPVESGARGWSSLRSATGSSSSSLAAPSSLGLFSGWGSPSCSSSHVDWSTGGSMAHCDYTCIDWSLDLTPLRPSVKSERLSNTWSTMFMGGKAARPARNGGLSIAGLQGSTALATEPLSSGSHEWNSPFAGGDLLSLPRQFVTSPPL